MNIWQAIILGFVQGVTEFLPISSSGHLVLVPHFLGWQFSSQEIFVFDVLVQWGTLLAVIIYFWQDLIKIIVAFLRGIIDREPFSTHDARMGWNLILATIPAVVLGFLLKDTVEAAFSSPRVTGGFLLVTAAILVIAEVVGKRQRSLEQITWIDALWIGFAQVLALFPGVSRSGSTIAGGMTRNLDRPAAARFSFLMSIPVMLGAGVLALLDLIQTPGLSGLVLPLLVGFLVALIIGYIAIRWLLAYLTHHSLYVFAIYCALLGLLAIVVG